MRVKAFVITGLLSVHVVCGFSQVTDDSLSVALSRWMENYSQPDFRPMLRVALNSVSVDEAEKTVHVYGNEGFASQSFTPQMVEDIYEGIRNAMPEMYRRWNLMVYGMNKEISTLVPNYLRKHQDESLLWGHRKYKGQPWTRNVVKPAPTKGLAGRHLCVWPSHGRYYAHESEVWKWQRPRLLCTTEDLLTQSFVTPFLIPMLRNSGAVVWSPRELDWQRNEVIVDDESTLYKETAGHKGWQTTSEAGYGWKERYCGSENPFNQGHARAVETVRNVSQASSARWQIQVAEDGDYAVYVSYPKMANAVSDARYTVMHNGIRSEFLVNQQIGAGTWVYLGTYSFGVAHNSDNCVILNNISHQKGYVAADAVKIGGGMGNISRSDADYTNVSGLPRHLEGARYYLQFAGMPSEIYNTKDGRNDYADDMNARSNALNYLGGGTDFIPAGEGLGVPFELSLAVHTDAGKTRDGSEIGTLVIHTEKNSDGGVHFKSGVPRMVSADLAGAIQLSVYNDIKSSIGHWTRRERFNRNYSETRLPEVPSVIVEMLSHQNFQDLKLGHDPNFKFLISRAIYKGVLRFVSNQHGENYVVHPLPVHAFQALLEGDNKVHLEWEPTHDKLEPTAEPDGYTVYMRTDGQDFDNGTFTKDTHLTVSLEPDAIYSFKVTASNKGGESFPSEILSVRQASHSQAEILIVNGFTRLSAPDVIELGDSVGFDMSDPGVSYQCTPEYCGPQVNFDPYLPDSEGHNAYGYSSGEWEGQLMGGNTFDYPYVHGKSIASCGQFSFSSSSLEAVERGKTVLNSYPVVDIIMGLQKDCGLSSIKPYKTFSKALQQQIAAYSNHGNLIVSGSYLASDMTTSDEVLFTSNILHYRADINNPAPNDSIIRNDMVEMTFERGINGRQYTVSRPDILVPTDDAFTAFTYSDGSSAVIANTDGRGKSVIMGIPFESIKDPVQRNSLMAGFLKIFWP